LVITIRLAPERVDPKRKIARDTLSVQIGAESIQIPVLGGIVN
jgi:hypothetical protein